MKKHFILVSFIAGVGSLSLSSCNSKEKQAEIDKLTEELEITRGSIESERNKFEFEQQENKDLVNENNQLKGDIRSLEDRAKSAERELERYKKRELAAKKVKKREPTSREKREASLKAAAERLPAIVSIAGDQSNACGTLVSADDKTWIYFSTDEVIGNTRLEITTSDGTKLEKFGDFEIAVDSGLARLELNDEVDSSLTPSEPVEMDSDFALMGVGESDEILLGRAPEATPEIVNGGIRFSKCATGTPAFCGEAAELLGIMVPLSDKERTLWPQPAGANIAPVVSRLDRTIKWTAIPIATLMEEAKKIADADRLTRLVLAFAATTPSSTGVSMGPLAGTSTRSEEIFEENKTSAPVKALFELDEWLKEKGDRASKADMNRHVSSVYGDILRISNRKTRKFSSASFSPYHAEAAAQSLEWRKDAERKLGELSESFD